MFRASPTPTRRPQPRPFDVRGALRRIPLAPALGLLAFIAGLVLMAGHALALPRYTARYGQDCILCHVNPTGGGMRSLYASAYLVPEEIAARNGADDALGAFDPALNEYVTVGADLQPVLTDQCVTCHGDFGNGGLDMRVGVSRSNLVGVTSSNYGIVRVVPGDPGASLLMRKLSGAAGVGSEMPPGQALADSTLAMFRSWIEAGAPDN